MCGIVGIYGNSAKCSSNITESIAHRGPDQTGVFLDADNNICLGHTRLSILDLSIAGRQPMSSIDENVVLVFNGEIYNFSDLKNDLLNKGVTFRSNSDTEVILNLYLQYGNKMLHMLNGIFAFSIWDKVKKSLFIARDGIGVKPLYYSELVASFIFASEIKALLGWISDTKELDYSALHNYLTFLWSPGSSTPFKEVKKLLPGEALLVQYGKIKKQWDWYRLPVACKIKPDIYTERGAISDCKKQLREAVHRQMISDVPVGAFLSGGLDSSAIVAFAKEINPNICCFTIDSSGEQGQEDGVTDDLPYAKKVARHFGVPLEVVSVDSNKIASDLISMVAMLDEPLADPATLNVFYISQLAKEHGIQVLLSGAGGDDVFTGYRRHYAVQFDKWLRLTPLSLRSYIEKYTASLNIINPFFRRLAKLFNGSALIGDERIINYFRWADQGLIFSLFRKEVHDELFVADEYNPMSDFLKSFPDSMCALERMLALEQRFFLPDHNLTYTDKMSMAAGVEVRVPFLDLKLVEFAARIPLKYKQRGRESKWILKKVMEPYLPHDVIYRPKSGFGVPLRHWMKFELRELLGDLLSEASLNKRGIFDSTEVHKLIKNNDAGVIDAAYTLFSLMCIEIWCRQFVDGQFDYNRVYGDT